MTPIFVDHDDINYSGLPMHMRGAARDYLEHHVLPGEFLTAVLQNDLVGAFGQADSTNTTAMKLWAIWLYNECPNNAWGSPEKVKAWIDAK